MGKIKIKNFSPKANPLRAEKFKIMEKGPKPFSEEKAKEIMEAEGLEERSQSEQGEISEREEALRQGYRSFEIIENSENYNITLKTLNHFQEGSDPYKKVETFFSEYLTSYNNYVKEKTKEMFSGDHYPDEIIKKIKPGDMSDFLSHPILDKTGEMGWFSSSWVNPMQPDEYEFSLQGGQTGWDVVAVWTIELKKSSQD